MGSTLLRVDAVRIEINCSTSSGGPRELLGRKNPHTFGD